MWRYVQLSTDYYSLVEVSRRLYNALEEQCTSQARVLQASEPVSLSAFSIPRQLMGVIMAQ